jgi:hypothetical protein
MVLNNSTTLSTCITFVATLSIDFGVLVYVVGFWDPYVEGPSSCTNILPNPKSNVCPSIDLGLLISTCNFGGLNITKGGCVSILFVCSPLACKPFCVCCCCCYYYCKCCGLSWLSI